MRTSPSRFMPQLQHHPLAQPARQPQRHSCPPGWSSRTCLPGSAVSFAPSESISQQTDDSTPWVDAARHRRQRTSPRRSSSIQPPTPGSPRPPILPDNVNVNNMACGVLTVGGTPQIYCVGGSASPAVPPSTARVFSYNPVTDTPSPQLTAADNWPGNTVGHHSSRRIRSRWEQALHHRRLPDHDQHGRQPKSGSSIQTQPKVHAGSNAWIIPSPRGYVPAATIGGLIYTAGGSRPPTGTTLTDTNDSFKYDPVANTWTAITNIPRATGETRAVVMNNQMWVLGGGRTLPNPGTEVDIYDPSTNAWTTGTAFVTGTA